MRLRTLTLLAVAASISTAGHAWQSRAASAPAAGAAAFRIRGRLLDEQGQPLAGAGVAAGPPEALVTAAALEHPIAKSRLDGTFDFAVERGRQPTRTELRLIAAAAGKAAVEWTVDLPAGPEGANEVFVGTVRLARGGTLQGRVWGPDARPLAGVRVVATDALVEIFPESHGAYGQRPRSVARSGPDGAFTLPCAFDCAATVRAEADGFYTQTRSPVHAGEPLRFELRPNGFVAGTVVDERGQPLGAEVEISKPRTWRLSVRAVDAVSGAAVTRFQLDLTSRSPDPDGALRMELPHFDTDAPGFVFPVNPYRATITAEGYAPCAVTYGAPADGSELRLEARLSQESALEGRVVDPATSRPVAGAQIVARRVEQGNVPPWHRSTGWATAGTEGRFRLGQLGPGTYEVWATAAGRPLGNITTVEVAAQQTRAGITLALEAGRAARGKLVGGPFPADWNLNLCSHELMRDLAVSAGAQWFPELEASRISPDGAFRFEGLRGECTLAIFTPAPPRTGTLCLGALGSGGSIHKLNVGETDWVGEVDVRSLLPGTLRGKVALTGAANAAGRLVVVATAEGLDAGDFRCGRRALVAGDGSFELLLAPDQRRRLHVLEVATGVLLARSPEAVTVTASQVHRPPDLRVAVTPVRARLQSAPGIRAPARLLIFGSAIAEMRDEQDEPAFWTFAFKEPGLDLLEAEEEVTFWVPPGATRVVVAGHGGEREESFTARAGEPVRITFTLPAPATPSPRR